MSEFPGFSPELFAFFFVSPARGHLRVIPTLPTGPACHLGAGVVWPT
jgi:hypothetical protein